MYKNAFYTKSCCTFSAKRTDEIPTGQLQHNAGFGLWHTIAGLSPFHAGAGGYQAGRDAVSFVIPQLI